jgi:hypothetical protein
LILPPLSMGLPEVEFRAVLTGLTRNCPYLGTPLH